METAGLLLSSSTPKLLFFKHQQQIHHTISIPVSVSSSQPLQKNITRSSSRRNFTTNILLLVSSSNLLLLPLQPAFAASKQEEEEEEKLTRYTDEEQGFTLLVPHSWKKVEKAGATALFQKGINNVGVVVSPVRLNSLPEFGTPQFVLDKLIQAEKRKESTKDVEVIGVAERSGHGGLQVYEFEYMLDSTRGGMKRIFSAAFVASKRLYLLNITHSDKPEDPLDPSTESLMENVLHSFDVASSI